MGGSDSYVWIGSSGGSWDTASDWEDVTNGADPATSEPGSNDPVAVAGATGSTYEVIEGGGGSASLGLTGKVDLVGAYGTGALDAGAVAGSANLVSFFSRVATVSMGSMVASTTVEMIDRDITITGAASSLSSRASSVERCVTASLTWCFGW